MTLDTRIEVARCDVDATALALARFVRTRGLLLNESFDVLEQEKTQRSIELAALQAVERLGFLLVQRDARLKLEARTRAARGG